MRILEPDPAVSGNLWAPWALASGSRFARVRRSAGVRWRRRRPPRGRGHNFNLGCCWTPAASAGAPQRTRGGCVAPRIARESILPRFSGTPRFPSGPAAVFDRFAAAVGKWLDDGGFRCQIEDPIGSSIWQIMPTSGNIDRAGRCAARKAVGGFCLMSTSFTGAAPFRAASTRQHHPRSSIGGAAITPPARSAATPISIACVRTGCRSAGGCRK